ncbi:MAG: 3-hydroxybutyryl-CoA dehydrogenase [Phycisphaerae bacterium]|jgi:3-hydroxybutyryl-CoA dehydrogenase|nr:3-hydroxybutyryl-CoA dehydrogenase [Phycisphaerae bacterium]
MSIKAQNSIGVIGAGTMGVGIAQAAAGAGWPVILFDIEQSLVDQAKDSITKRFQRLVEKNRITESEATSCQERINATTSMEDLSNCDLIVEAIVENYDIKVKVLKQVGSIAPDAVIATNTSSLSITDLGDACGFSDRVVGMHFFNPAPIMPLVEIIRGKNSRESSIQRATLLAEAWGKTVVHVSDTPGFIVNRVARPYYLESWRILEDGLAAVDFIDKTMQSLGEFKMGPFMLTDLIGQDINVATTRSVWERLGNPTRLAPSAKQESLIDHGHFGRKSGCGAYAHDDKDNIVPAVFVGSEELEISEHLSVAINDFCLGACCTSGSMLEKYIFARVLGGIINEALWTSNEGVATTHDIDTAMKLGTNYPLGPIEWLEKIGVEKVQCLLSALNETVDDNRFASPPFGTISAQ